MNRPTHAPFRAFLDGMPDMNQGGGWTVRQWRKVPIEHVRLTDLIATNRHNYLNERVISRYLKPRKHELEPCVIEHHGQLYLADGHHRAVAAYRCGETHIQARVMRINQRGQ